MKNSLAFLLVLLMFASVACNSRSGKDTKNPHLKDRNPSNLIGYYQCNRCHEISGTGQIPSDDKDCRGCHVKIKEGTFRGPFNSKDIARWRQRINHFLLVPSLNGVSKRFKREWFENFISSPHIIRPNLGSMMPKLDLTAEDSKIIANYFYSNDKPDSVATNQLIGDKQRGEQLFISNDCRKCHLVDSGERKLDYVIGPSILERQIAMAPDLSHTKARMDVTQIYNWLKDPKSIKLDALMPKLHLEDGEIRDLVSYILAIPDNRKNCNVNIDLKLIPDRKILYTEIDKKIFKNTCWHCHSDPIPMKGDGGPGNTGGFGFKGKGVDFTNYDSLLKGKIDGAGKRQSILKDDSTGAPIIISHLIARHYEASCNKYSEIRGMPLGLPPVDSEDINLLFNWIKQGAER